MSRTCTKCHAEKEKTEFYKVTQRGVTRLRAVCKECSKAQLRDRSNDPQPAGRVCTQCGVYQPLSAFHKHKICQYGVEPMCKSCRLEKRREYSRKYPERIRNTDLQQRYGITLDDYNAMFARQEGKCAICGTGDKKLVVDHDHATGRVRRLLCSLCNAMLGCARENIQNIAYAIAYLHADQHPQEAGALITLTFARGDTPLESVSVRARKCRVASLGYQDQQHDQGE